MPRPRAFKLARPTALSAVPLHWAAAVTVPCLVVPTLFVQLSVRRVCSLPPPRPHHHDDWQGLPIFPTSPGLTYKQVCCNALAALHHQTRSDSWTFPSREPEVTCSLHYCVCPHPCLLVETQCGGLRGSPSSSLRSRRRWLRPHCPSQATTGPGASQLEETGYCQC